jgi:hypothetical protein
MSSAQKLPRLVGAPDHFRGRQLLHRIASGNPALGEKPAGCKILLDKISKAYYILWYCSVWPQIVVMHASPKTFSKGGENMAAKKAKKKKR